MKAFLRKVPGGALIPDNEESEEALKRIKLGRVIKVEFTESRNYRFLKKFFALLDVGFEAWEPDDSVIEKYGCGDVGPIQKNREQFRKECTIAAGFYEAHYTLEGVTLEAKSIAFANMEDDEFERVYSKVADVLLQKVLRNYTRADLDQVVERILGFV